MDKMSRSERDRVVAEKNDLEEKIGRLSVFLSDPFINKDDEDVKLLKQQLEYMQSYSEILCKRLSADYEKVDTDYKEISTRYEVEVRKIYNEIDDAWYHVSIDIPRSSSETLKRERTEACKRLDNWKNRLYKLLEGK